MKAVDVTARVEADGVSIKLPRLVVKVEQRQAERLRDVLNAVLPVHHPRPADVEILRAARSILEERGQDAESIGHALWSMEQAGVPMDAAPPKRLHLLHLWGDVDPELSGPYRDEQDRTEAAQDYRRAHGEENGVVRVDAAGDVSMSSFTGGELEMPKPLPARSCERCGSDPAPYRLQGVALCGSCDELLQAVAVGDRVRDPHDGTWREVVRIDGIADGGTCHMRDGGCMSVAECVAAEQRLPGEALS